MSWQIGYDQKWKRDIGYGVPAVCDHPGCNNQIDRGLSYVCSNSEPYGGDGCGLYFCSLHIMVGGECDRCRKGKPPFNPKPDIAEWIRFKLTDDSWAKWREENPEWVKTHKANAILDAVFTPIE